MAVDTKCNCKQNLRCALHTYQLLWMKVTTSAHNHNCHDLDYICSFSEYIFPEFIKFNSKDCHRNASVNWLGQWHNLWQNDHQLLFTVTPVKLSESSLRSEMTNTFRRRRRPSHVSARPPAPRRYASCGGTGDCARTTDFACQNCRRRRAPYEMRWQHGSTTTATHEACDTTATR